MQLPPNLTEVLDQARGALQCHSWCHLDPYFRYEIYQALESHRRAAIPQRRICLDILTARHVLFIWEAGCPEDRTPHHLLTLAEQGLLQPLNYEEIAPILHEAQDVIDEIGDRYIDDNQPFLQEQQERIAHAGQAAYQALIMALRHLDNFSDTIEKYREQDPENVLRNTAGGLAPEDSDTAEWAHWAYSEIGSSNFSRHRSLEFWAWWLDEAVPKAWAYPFQKKGAN